MGNLIFTPTEENSQKEQVDNINLEDTSITPHTDTTPVNIDEMFERSIEPMTTYTEEESVTTNSTVTTTAEKFNDIEVCHGCSKSNITLYTRGMAQVRVCGNCIDG